MRKIGKRIATLAGVTASAAGLSLAMTAPAQATAADCQNYLSSMGYVVGSIVINNCANVANADGTSAPIEQALCTAALIKQGVQNEHAQEACIRGRW